MSNNKSSSYDNFRAAMKSTPRKDKILMIAQSAISVMLIILVILATNNIVSRYIMQIGGMFMLLALLIVSAIRMLPARKFYGILYIALACLDVAYIIYLFIYYK